MSKKTRKKSPKASAGKATRAQRDEGSENDAFENPQAGRKQVKQERKNQANRELGLESIA